MVRLFFVCFDPNVRKSYFTGITASVPNVSLNGVSPDGTLVVILYAHRTLGNFSSHALFGPSSRVLIILSKLLFVTSV